MIDSWFIRDDSPHKPILESVVFAPYNSHNSLQSLDKKTIVEALAHSLLFDPERVATVTAERTFNDALLVKITLDSGATYRFRGAYGTEGITFFTTH